MIGFMIGCLVGSTVGILAASLCAAAGHSDREMNCTDLDDKIR